MNPTAPFPRLTRRAVHGVVLIDKPLGWTSNDVLQKVKNSLRAEKAGHTGTLDPLATGLLPLCFGAATKFSQISLQADKSYQATLKLGICTSTGDREGQIIKTSPVVCTAQQIEFARARLTGAICQVPPMHSALKKNGKALYEYARAGIQVERAPREVFVHCFDILAQRRDEIDIQVTVSKGTYIRTLAEDFGTLLGCGAHLMSLRRIRSDPVDISAALGLDIFLNMSDAERMATVLPPEVLLAHWPTVQLDAEDAQRFLCGMRRKTALPDCASVRVYGPDEGALLGIAKIFAGELIASRVLSPSEVQHLMVAVRNRNGFNPEKASF